MPTARIRVRLQPRAARNQIVGWHGDALKVQVHAPPLDEAANHALLGLLARALRIAPSCLRIVHGHKGRDKLIEVDGLSQLDGELRIREICRVDKKNPGD